MKVTVNGNVFFLNFAHDPDFQPPHGQRKHYPRHVKGRTTCFINRIIIHKLCPKHGDLEEVGRSFGGTVEQINPSKDDPCICEKRDVIEKTVYCSRLDTYTREDGRFESLRQALLEAFPSHDADGAKHLLNAQTRRVFWITYLDRFPANSKHKQQLRHERKLHIVHST
jgi:hypothetical protein